MGAERPTPRQVVLAELRGVDLIAPEKMADRLLTAITDRMRVELGPRDCGCGGCDSCAQQALVDWLDPG